jgi:photosystem II stability/assembly factor-like uncharacterized protein
LLIIALFLAFPLSGQKPAKPQRVQSTDPALRLDGFVAHQELVKSSPFNKLKWSHIGPTNVSGRCTDIAVVQPKGKNYVIYVATASGGVWKTENEGTTWVPIFDRAASTSIGDIALAPTNPEIVWVGTGEANIFRSSQAGIGIYKSTDGGKTWQHMGLTDTYTIARIVVHPQNPDIVYVAASGHEWTDNPERGVYKTTDGGKSWEKVLYIRLWTPRTATRSTLQSGKEYGSDGTTRGISPVTRRAESTRRPTEERPGNRSMAGCPRPDLGAGSVSISA